MFDFLFLVLSLPVFALAWRCVEWLVSRCARAPHNAPRYVTLLYDVLAVSGGIVLAFSQVWTVGIAFVNVEPYSVGDLFFISLIGYLVYNFGTPLTRRHREVSLHHVLVGGVLIIAIVWGYPSMILPLWLLVELTELVAQMRYFMQHTRWEQFGVRLEYWVRVVKLIALIPVLAFAHSVPWYWDAPLWVAAIYFALMYYLMWMYIYEVRLSAKRVAELRTGKR